MRETYPPQFRLPELNGYALTVEANLRRSPNDGGRVQQRRISSTIHETAGVTFKMTSIDYGHWFYWMEVNGYKWFEMAVFDGSEGADRRCIGRVVRLIAPLEMKNMQSFGWVEVSTALEIAPHS